MKVTFNEAAQLQKVSSLEEAASIYQQFLDTYKALVQDNRITNKVEFVGKMGNIAEPITDNGEQIYDLQRIWGKHGKDMYRQLLTFFSSLASTKRTPVPNKNFTVDNVTFLIPEDDSNAMLISLKTSPKYGALNIDGMLDNGYILCMKNIAAPSQIEEYEHRLALGIRIYERNDKHKTMYTSMGNGEQSSPMDLCDQDAQAILNQACFIGPEKVLYGLKDGKCYGFREHIPGKAIYHGYLIENPSDKVRRVLGLR